jgi:hypothetical protein
MAAPVWSPDAAKRAGYGAEVRRRSRMTRLERIEAKLEETLELLERLESPR